MKHIVHTVDPLLAYLPVSQAVHVEAVVAPAVVEYVPEAQLVHALAPATGEYEPAVQFVHCRMLLAPTVSEYLPEAQLVHVDTVVEPEVTEYLPVPQLMHVIELLAPTVSEYFPASQLVQSAGPDESLYFPGTQDVHVPPFTPVYPGLQAQPFNALHPIQELPEFPGHDLHAAESVAPVMSKYLPPTHAVHVSPFGPVKPELQVQVVITKLDAGEYELVGQLKHVDAPVVIVPISPFGPTYVPAGQGVHEPVGLTEYVPVGQAEQMSFPPVEYVPLGHVIQSFPSI